MTYQINIKKLEEEWKISGLENVAYTDVKELVKKNGTHCYYKLTFEAARNGHEECIKFWSNLGVGNPSQILIQSARAGQVGCLKLARKMGGGKGSNISDLHRAQGDASAFGHRECMNILNGWGASPRNGLSAAAYYGRLEEMKILKGWGATNFLGSFYNAARGGQLEALKLLKGWGVKRFKGAQNIAEENNHPECVKLLEEWISKL